MMPSMTDSMSGLADSIARERRFRAEAATQRRGSTRERSRAVAAQCDAAAGSRGAAARAYRTAAVATRAQRARDVDAMLAGCRSSRLAWHRQQMEGAAAQRRRLAAFMADLTAGIGTLRDQFRTDLADRRAALRMAADGVHGQTEAARRDRRGAGDAWAGRKPAAPARPAADRAPRAQPARPAETAASAARPWAHDTAPAAPAAPAAKAEAPTARPTVAAEPATDARPRAMTPPPIQPARGHAGSSHATDAGKLP
jgi:hypothetical protein